MQRTHGGRIYSHFAHIELELEDPVAMQAAYGPRLHRIEYRTPPKTKGFVMRCLRWVGRRINWHRWYLWGVDDWYDDGCDAALFALQRQHHFDAVLVEYVFMSQAFKCFTNGHLKILDTHDVMTNRHRIFATTGRPPPLHFSTTAPEEAKALNRADIVLAIQDREAEFFQTSTSGKVTTFGHVTPVDNRYVQRVKKRVRSHIGEAELLLAGRICDTVPDEPGVRKLGTVDNVSDAYDLGDVVVNPMLYGTGLNIKSIEALGFGMPLLSTPVGCRGLEAGANTAYWLAQSDREFAEKALDLLGDAEARQKLSAAASRFAQEWNRKQVEALLSCLGSPPGVDVSQVPRRREME